MDPNQINTGVLLREAYQQIVENLHRQFDALGYGDIRPAHGQVFQHIAPEGSRLTDLADRAHMTKQSMSYLVESLEKAGYLERLPDTTDRRAVLFRLTEKGRALQALGRSINRAYEKGWAEKIGADNMETLRRLLTMILA